jgi:demethylmenaquinone methyltransferase/2-methoxy-6-polyprenyl-1,4-benzoquinol methylase
MKPRGNDEHLVLYQGPDSRSVQRMFAGIAPRYDFLNHLLSGSVDRYWRRIAVHKVRELAGSVGKPVCLDLCSGTGDLALALHRALNTRIIASDFCHPMLTRSNRKIDAAGCGQSVRTIEADALALPFPDSTFDALTIGFGLRNLEDPYRGLQEMHRVLKHSGALVVLEFSKPVVPVFREIFNFYFNRILPRLGAIVSRDDSAYRYLPSSVQRFPSQTELAALMRSAGFSEVDYRNLTGGIAALHWGRAG